MNADYASQVKRSSLCCILYLISAILLFGCESSTENEKPEPEKGALETRIIYQKSDSGDMNFYTSDLSGRSEFFYSLDKFGYPDQFALSFNTIMNKIIYYNESAGKIIICNTDGSDPAPVELEGTPGKLNNVHLHCDPTGSWIYCQTNYQCYKVKMDGSGVKIITPFLLQYYKKPAYNKIYKMSFTEDGYKFAFGMGAYLAVRDSTGEVVKLYRGYDSYDVKIMPKGERIFFTNGASAGVQYLYCLDLGIDLEIKISSGDLNVSDFSISPDGKYVAYSAGTNDRYSIYLYDIASHETKIIINDAGYNKYVLFVSNDQIIWHSDVNNISIMKINGAEKKELLKNVILVGSGLFKTR